MGVDLHSHFCYNCISFLFLSYSFTRSFDICYNKYPKYLRETKIIAIFVALIGIL